MWNNGGPSAPSIQAHVFDSTTLLDSNGKTIDEYIQSCFASKTRYSANDSYYHNPLRADQIMNFFKDIKQLNYFYVQGATRGSAFPYNNSKGCQTERTYHDGSTPSTFNYSDIVWHDQIYYRYYNGSTEYHWDEHTTSNFLTFTLYSSGDMKPKTLIDLSIWGGFYVNNYAAKHNSYSEYGDITDVTKYVLAPIKPSYQNMMNVSVPTVSSNELSTAINLVYSTAGLEKNAIDIPCGEPPPTTYSTVYHDAYTSCQLWDFYFFSHVNYCTLENVSVA